MLRIISALLACIVIVAAADVWASFDDRASRIYDGVAAIEAELDHAEPTSAEAPQVFALTNPKPAPLTLPQVKERVQLGPFSHVWQTLGNCGPATLSMLLSYYSVRRSQAEIAKVVKPRTTDPSVHISQLAEYAQGLDFGTRVGVNGSLDMVMGMLSLDIPVMVTHLYNYDGGTEHFRLVKGYDRAKRALTFEDSLTGPNQTLGFAQFDAVWQPSNRAYLLVYPLEKEALVAAVLGDDWDEATMRARALAAAEEWVAREPKNAFAHFVLGESRLALGQAAAAWSAYERAFALGMPRRTLWYNQGPVEALVQGGSYAEALRLIESTLAIAPDVEELHYLRGRVLDGLGRAAEAWQAYARALAIRPNYAAVQQALAAKPGP